jgi:hypothetical protein
MSCGIRSRGYSGFRLELGRDRTGMRVQARRTGFVTEKAALAEYRRLSRWRDACQARPRLSDTVQTLCDDWLCGRVQDSGDFDNDGYEDIALVHRLPDDGADVHVVWGGSGTPFGYNPTFTRRLLASDGWCRSDMKAESGKYNPDAFSDLAILHRLPDNGIDVHILYGSVGTPFQYNPTFARNLPASDGWDWNKVQATSGFFNNDPYEDVAVLKQRADGGADVHVLWGSVAGCAVRDEIIHDGVRQSPFRSYIGDPADRPNLTVLPNATVSRVLLSCGRATGVEIIHDGKPVRALACGEVVLSLGAINAPSVLLRSGIGDEEELRSFGIPVVQHLPGVGRNLNDHIRFGCMWQTRDEVSMPAPARSQSVCFWADDTRPGAPEFVMYVSPGSSVSAQSAAQYPPPDRAFTLMPAIRPRGTGRVRLSGVDPMDRPRIDTNFLSDPDDVRSALSGVEMTREIGNSAALRPFVKREVSPGTSAPAECEAFLRNAVETYWHQCGTAKMGSDELSVVDAALRVHGIAGLRVADASVLPKVTVANTMAPCVVVGERAAELLAAEHS